VFKKSWQKPSRGQVFNLAEFQGSAPIEAPEIQFTRLIRFRRVAGTAAAQTNQHEGVCPNLVRGFKFRLLLWRATL
jgi:hypothetical protein